MQEISKIPPQAIDLENMVLGAILVEGGAYQKVSEYLSPETFYKEQHQIIYSAIEKLAYNNEPIDLITVTNQLRDSSRLDESGGPAYLASLTIGIGSASHIENHAKIIAEKYIRREFIKSTWELNNAMYDEQNELLDEINRFDNFKMDILSFTAKDEKHIAQAIDEMQEYSIKLHNNEIPRGIPTGYKYYDEFSGGFQSGDFVIIAGETSNGKTTLALNIAKNMAEQNIPVAIYSYEMTIFQLTARLVAHTNNISSKDIIRGTFNESQMIDIGRNVTKLRGSETYLIKPNGTNFGRLINDISRMVKLYKVKVVFIDYLQLLSNNKKNASQADMIAEMANRLKSLAVELDICIVLLSQLSRDRNKPRPTMTRLKGSGDIENAADVVMFTYLPYKYGFSVEDVNGESQDIQENAIIIVAKGRNIGTTEFMLSFKKEVPAFFNYHFDRELPPMEYYEQTTFDDDRPF